MTAKICKCCGQLIPPALALPPVKQRLYDFVARNPQGVNAVQIASHVWADDPNGGPEDYLASVRSHVFQMNKILVKQGVAVKSCLGRGATYTLRTL
jgi:hypothetical protein